MRESHLDQGKTVGLFPLDENEGAFSLAIVPFTEKGGKLHLVVGTAVDAHVSPKSFTRGYFRTYAFSEDGLGLELLHKVEKKLFITVRG